MGIQEYTKKMENEFERILQTEDFKEILPYGDTRIATITTRQTNPLEKSAIYRVATNKNTYIVCIVLKDGYDSGVYLPNVVTHVVNIEALEGAL